MFLPLCEGFFKKKSCAWKLDARIRVLSLIIPACCNVHIRNCLRNCNFIKFVWKSLAKLLVISWWYMFKKSCCTFVESYLEQINSTWKLLLWCSDKVLSGRQVKRHLLHKRLQQCCSYPGYATPLPVCFWHSSHNLNG